MKPKSSFLPLLWLLVALLLLVSCSNPASRSKTTPTINGTQARQTVETRLTQFAGTPWPSSGMAGSPTVTATSAAPTPNPTSSMPPTLTVAPPADAPTATTYPQITADASCDKAAAGYPAIDVTIDDDTEIAPGTSFTKI